MRNTKLKRFEIKPAILMVFKLKLQLKLADDTKSFVDDL